MRTRSTLAALLVLGTTACGSMLETNPDDSVPIEQHIVDAAGARAARVGMFESLRGGHNESYYGSDWYAWGDLSSDNATTGGFSASFIDAALNRLRADNAIVKAIWQDMYDAINRANMVLARVPEVSGLDDEERNQILGEAYLIRGLTYHNLVRVFGGVPLILTPTTEYSESNNVTRATVADVYTQIVADLTKAEQLMTATSPTTYGTVGAAKALLARVHLYRGDYEAAEAKADEVIDMGYTLAPDYRTLFDAEGTNTPEDIFKVLFTAQQYNWIGYYGHNSRDGGNNYVKPTQDLLDAYEPADTIRFNWTIARAGTTRVSFVKWPTTYGAEDIHVIRFAEVLLIKAECQARRNDLSGAVDTYNLIRERVKLPPHVLGTDVTTQDEVLAAIDHERRIELAYEGDRWPDLIRTNRAVAYLASQGAPATQALYPIPQSEIDVAPGLVQNPGY